VRPGVAAIVRDHQDRVLLHLRVVGGGWAPPSGAVEPGESVRGALERELGEETGLEVDEVDLVGVYSDPAYQIVGYPDGRSVQFITCLFTCRVLRGVLRGSGEGRQWRWFDPGSFPDGLLSYAEVWLADALSGHGGVAVR
jgi:8-oxo-dGTP pyrophosphatase MutT (NUDIX family)